MSEIDFGRFVCTDSVLARYAIGAPFFQDGFKVATDGRILIRVPGFDKQDSERCPNVQEVFDKCQTAVDVPITETGFSDDECIFCYGTKHRCVECDTCGEDIELKDLPCERCNATGKERAKLEVEGCLFSGHYIHIICQELKNPKVVRIDKKDDGQILFTFDGGDGCLKGIAKD
jgi:hypothetical protein